jgi:hypothetical protein
MLNSALELAAAAFHRCANLLLLVTLAGCSLEHASTDIRYRLDVSLKVDGQEVTGSSVYELRMSSGGGSGAGTISRVVTQFEGQAIVVRLPEKPLLVVLMTTGNAAGFRRLFLHSCGIKIGDGESLESYFDRVTRFQGPCDVALNLIKILAIGDPGDPKTFHMAGGDNLSASFGSGVSLVSATVTRTTEPVTSGIRAILPWVLKHGELVPRDYILWKANAGINLSSDLFSIGDI